MTPLRQALIAGGLLVALASACGGQPATPAQTDTPSQPTMPAPPSEPSPTAIPVRSRLEAIPAGAAMTLPEADPMPPVLHSEEWLPPVPLPGPINTAGAEDSAFVTPDGNRMIFFFTPLPQLPPEQQLFDGVTGLYLSELSSGAWSEPRRLILQDPERLALDGCAFLLGEELWFCSAREGNYRGIDLWIADLPDGTASNWRNAGQEVNQEIGVGEMHLGSDGQTIYFHAPRPGASDFDLFLARREGEGWGPAEPIALLNTEETEGWPFLTEDGQELWFTRITGGAPAVFRSVWGEADWSAPEMIVSVFAGEPTLDRAGNLYFIHHYIVDGAVADADIFFAARR